MKPYYETMNLKETDNRLHSCENCGAIENGHYCLLYGKPLKNADIITCPDWKEQEE